MNILEGIFFAFTSIITYSFILKNNGTETKKKLKYLK